MGVLPGGATDVNTTDGIYLVSAYGNGDMSASALVGNDEATVKAVFKNKYLNNSSSVWGNPSGVLAQVFGVLGAIPGMGLVEAIIAAIINAIVTVLGPIPIIGGMVETLANFLGVTRTTATSAQSTANTAAVGVSVLQAPVAGSGNVFSDTFNEAAGIPPAGPYDRVMGSGSGTWLTNGSGALVWTPGGSTPQACMDRVTTPIVDGAIIPATSLASGISVVLTNGPRPGGGFGTFSSQISLLLRCNAAKDTYVLATLDGWGTVEIGYTVAGVYTRLGSAVSVTYGGGDTWRFHAGEPGVDDYQFELLQNGVTVCPAPGTGPLIDSGHASQLGTGFDTGALVAAAGTVVFGFATFQIEAPSVEVLNIFDRTP